MKRLLVCGATGFIGRNLLERFLRRGGYAVTALRHRRSPPVELRGARGLRWLKADLTRREDVERVLRGQDIVLQAAATTSGAKDILANPTIHVTDNAVMNAFLFRAAHERGVGHVVFFSCTVMYPPLSRPVKEEDFDGRITDKYFASGWTKAYNEKMAEFYSRLGRTKYTVIRHSNVYGPHDKYELERSHVTGATITKVMTVPGDAVAVWGDGAEARDLLYVDDLVDFVSLALRRQRDPFALVNVGLGRAVSVRRLVEAVIAASGRKLRLEFDRSKPTIPFSLALDCSRARELFGWRPKTSLERGLKKTLAWYRENVTRNESPPDGSAGPRGGPAVALRLRRSARVGSARSAGGSRGAGPGSAGSPRAGSRR